MKTSEFQYYLPEELIAQQPVEPRDDSRLMVLRRSDSSLEHRTFREIVEFLSEGDVLVFNDSRVIPARITGSKLTTGGRAEIL
ncbi:MAG: S-adenosylmethionine:tRNA ribosyltransferase-isomerase, partial [Dehalococcoidales bacterium]